MKKWTNIFRWLEKEKDGAIQSYVCENIKDNDELKKFYLHLDNVAVGELSFSNNQWCFKYAEDFINNVENLNLIVGFPDLNKVYCSNQLWPFFKIRIPGLKQPRVKEILKQENIDINNDVKLLERFGKRTISNPYELEVCI